MRDLRSELRNLCSLQRKPEKKTGLNGTWSHDLAYAIVLHSNLPSEPSIHLMHGNRMGHWFKSCNCVSLIHSYDLSNMTYIKFYSWTQAQTRKVVFCFVKSSFLQVYTFWSELTCDDCKKKYIYFYAESIIIIIISGNWTMISKYPAFGSQLFSHSNHLRIFFIIHCYYY